MLNLGCGSITPESWTNVDYALGAWLFKIPGFRTINKHFNLFNLNWNDRIVLQDLRKTFPWKSNSVDVIYCSHMLEHMTKVEGQRFLKECYRVLMPGGIVRILVPDLSLLVNDYVNKKIPAEDFVQELGCWNSTSRISMLISYPHKCMYDAPALIRTMSNVGFRCQNNKVYESKIADIYAIESLSGTAPTSVIVEGSKPILSTNNS